jgi:hypothetical protein
LAYADRMDRNALGNKPFLPSDRRPGLVFERSILASIRATLDPQQSGAEAIAKRLWPNDKATPLLLRAAINPTSTTNASALAVDTAADFVGALAPISAAAKLIALGMRVSLDGINSVSIPRRQGGKPATAVGWVTQGAPIPVKQYTLDHATLGPTCKLALLVGVTRELAEYADGDSVIMTLVREDLAASLDASIFSNAAAVAGTRPAGLFVGATVIGGAAAGADAMATDLEKLAGAVLDAGGSEVVFIASPKQAAAIQLRMLTPNPPRVWSCPALPAGTIAAVEPSAFVSAFGPVPKIRASKEATPQFDTNPTPDVIAAPMRSAWQTDTIIIRAILDATWCMRATGMVSVIVDAHWGA